MLHISHSVSKHSPQDRKFLKTEYLILKQNERQFIETFSKLKTDHSGNGFTSEKGLPNAKFLLYGLFLPNQMQTTDLLRSFSKLEKLNVTPIYASPVSCRIGLHDTTRGVGR